MSEKRFERLLSVLAMSDERFERWNDCSCKVKDNQEGILLNWEDVVQKLNEQQTEIDDLKEENRQLRQFINKNRRLYGRLQEKEYRKHCSGDQCYSLNTSDNRVRL